MRSTTLLAPLTLLAALACNRGSDLPEPGPLEVGVARVRMPAPVGIGTVGFGGFGVDADPSPFAELYPATKRVHLHPSFEAVVLSRGEGHELILVRTDTVGVFQQLRRSVVLELEERLGRDVDDALVLAATHTHSGPGRVIDGGGLFDLIADRFLPEHYERTVDAIADSVEAAYADLAPGRVGWAFGYTDEAHDDRRCEDGEDHENGILPILAVEQDGELAAAVVVYAIHGTVLGIEALTLSQDVSGGIEHQVEDRFDHPVEVLHLNSWAADMAPSSPSHDTEGAATQPSGYDRIEAVGAVVADAVEEALADVAWEEDPAIGARLYRSPIDRAWIGYADGEFPYEHGGVYCEGESDCDPSTTIEGLDQSCIAFTSDYPAPTQTEMSVAQVGSVHLLTFPGEPGTKLAERILEEARQREGVEEVVFVGYAQDYLGYSIGEEDWWQGGYEAGGALWGPRQGEYLATRALDGLDRFLGRVRTPFGPGPVEPFDVEGYTAYVPETPVDLGGVVEEVEASYGPTDTVRFVVAGADPWLGTPLATLETADGAPVLRPNGLPVDGDGLAFWIELATEPSYGDDPDAAERGFHWAVHLPVRHAVPSGLPELSGSYRIRVAVPTSDGAIEVVSEAFEVVP